MKQSFLIKGIHCEACVNKIKAALQPQVKIISINAKPPRLMIETEQPVLLEQLNLLIATAGDYELIKLDETVNTPAAGINEATPEFKNYYPLLLIASYIIGVALLSSFEASGINWHQALNKFMAGFFLVFSGFKFLDLAGFAQGYATYDLLAKRCYSYGYLYPFLELALGILYLLALVPTLTHFLTIIVMGFSSLGVIKALYQKQQIRCACLGTILKVPLSSITLIEDLLMVMMALVQLISG